GGDDVVSGAVGHGLVRDVRLDIARLHLRACDGGSGRISDSANKLALLHLAAGDEGGRKEKEDHHHAQRPAAHTAVRRHFVCLRLLAPDLGKGLSGMPRKVRPLTNACQGVAILPVSRQITAQAEICVKTALLLTMCRAWLMMLLCEGSRIGRTNRLPVWKLTARKTSPLCW